MARPNVDIPNYLIGGVKDYADENDISRDEAHAQLLKKSLSDAGIIGCSGSDTSKP